MTQEKLTKDQIFHLIQEKTKNPTNYQRTTTLCFPRNHNSLLPIVIGVWDKGNNVGTTSITYESNNAYEAPIEFDFKLFESFDEFKNQIQQDVAFGMSEGAKICDLIKADDIESETTFLMSLYRKDKEEVLTIKCPSSPISISENSDEVIMTLFVKTDLKKEKIETIILMLEMTQLRKQQDIQHHLDIIIGDGL